MGSRKRLAMRKRMKALDCGLFNASPLSHAVSSPAQKILDEYRRQDRVHAGSLIISVLGDAVMPRGGRVWLGSLIRLLAPLGVNERLVRTAVFRLVRDEWLTSERSGRRTDYLLTPSGEQRIDEASRLIYAGSMPQWDRRWRLIVTAGELSTKDRERLRKALLWHGFGSLNNDCFVHPSVDLIAVFDALAAEGLGGLVDRLKPLIAADAALGMAASDAAMVRWAWDLEQLAEMYRDFVARYRPALGQLRDGGLETADETAFLLRVVAEFTTTAACCCVTRRCPRAAAADWPGQKARLLCSELYRRLLVPSERHLDAAFQLADGVVPGASARLHERFRDTDLLALPA